MTTKNWMTLFGILFAIVIQLIALLLFEAPSWAGWMMFFVALIYFRTVMDD